MKGPIGFPLGAQWGQDNCVPYWNQSHEMIDYFFQEEKTCSWLLSSSCAKNYLVMFPIENFVLEFVLESGSPVFFYLPPTPLF